MPETSTKPYLIRAIYEWCTDNGFTPYIAVFVDNSTNVPREFVKNDEIVLNVSFDATSQLDMGNEWITFHARFSGVSRKIEVPVENVLAVYARENGQGMAFPVAAQGEGAAPVEGSPLTSVPAAGGSDESSASHMQLVSADAPADEVDDAPQPPKPPAGGGPRPALKRIK